MKVMVVDDTSMMRAVVKDILVKFCGIVRENVIEAESGEKALGSYAMVKPDLVFLDISMPGMDGITVVKELKKIDAGAKIIMCTSSGDSDDVEECVEAGAVDYILKPPNPQRMLQAVERAAGKTLQEIKYGAAEDGGDEAESEEDNGED